MNMALVTLKYNYSVLYLCTVQLPAGAVAIFSIGGDEQFKAAVAKSRTSLGDSEQVRLLIDWVEIGRTIK